MRPKIAMLFEYGNPTRKRWRSRYGRRTQSSTRVRTLLLAVACVAGGMGIGGVYPQIIDLIRGGSANLQGTARAEPAPALENIKMTQEPQPPPPARPGWVAQLIGDSSETVALSRFHQMQGRLRSVLGGYEPAILRTTVKSNETPIWVRVRIEFETRQGAESLCSKLEAAREPCVVQRNSER
jgi:hypothetical protein